MLGEGGHHLIALVQAQQTGVDEHADQLVADGLVQQRRHHRGIHAAGQAQQHLVPAHLRAHARDAVVDDVAGRPGVGAAADVAHEALEDAHALLGVGHFGVELQAVEAASSSAMPAMRRVGGAGDELEAGRQRSDPVAVAHPDVEDAAAFRRGVIFDVVAAGAECPRARTWA